MTVFKDTHYSVVHSGNFQHDDNDNKMIMTLFDDIHLNDMTCGPHQQHDDKILNMIVFDDNDDNIHLNDMTCGPQCSDW